MKDKSILLGVMDKMRLFFGSVIGYTNNSYKKQQHFCPPYCCYGAATKINLTVKGINYVIKTHRHNTQITCNQLFK